MTLHKFMQYGKYHSLEEFAKKSFLYKIVFVAGETISGKNLAYPLMDLYAKRGRLFYGDKELLYHLLTLALLDKSADLYKPDEKIQARKIGDYSTKNIAKGLKYFQKEMERKAEEVGKKSLLPFPIIEIVNGEPRDILKEIKKCADRCFSSDIKSKNKQLSLSLP